MSFISPNQDRIEEETSFQDSSNATIHDMGVTDNLCSNELAVKSEENHISSLNDRSGKEAEATVEKSMFPQTDKYLTNNTGASDNVGKESLNKEDHKNTNAGTSLFNGSFTHRLKSYVESCNIYVPGKQHLNKCCLKPCYVQLTKITLCHQSLDSKATSVDEIKTEFDEAIVNVNDMEITGNESSKGSENTVSYVNSDARTHTDNDTTGRQNLTDVPYVAKYDVSNPDDSPAFSFVNDNDVSDEHFDTDGSSDDYIPPIKLKRRIHHTGKNKMVLKRNRALDYEMDLLKPFEHYMKWIHNHQCLICKEIFDDVHAFRYHLFNTEHCLGFYTYYGDKGKVWHCKPCDYIVVHRNKYQFFEHLVIQNQHGQMGCVNIRKAAKTRPHQFGEGLKNESSSVLSTKITHKETIDLCQNDILVTENIMDENISKGSDKIMEQAIKFDSVYCDLAIDQSSASLQEKGNGNTHTYEASLFTSSSSSDVRTPDNEAGGWFCKVCNKSIANLRRSKAVRHILLHQSRNELQIMDEQNLFSRNNVPENDIEISDNKREPIVRKDFFNEVQNNADRGPKTRQTDVKGIHHGADKCSILRKTIDKAVKRNSERNPTIKLNVFKEGKNDAKMFSRTKRNIVGKVENELGIYPKRRRRVVKDVQTEAEKNFDEFMEWKYNMRCLICKEVFSERSEFSLHILNEKHCVQLYSFVKDGIKYLRCPPCQFVCTQRRSRDFLKHLIKTKQHGEMGCVNVSNLTCTKMEDNNDIVSQLDVDKTEIHSDVNMDSPDFSSSESKLLRGGWHCKLCKMTVSSCWNKYDATAHIKRHHTKELTYKCKICSQLLASDFNFKKHMQIHVENPSHQCPVCGKTFTCKKNVYHHERAVHKLIKLGTGKLEKKHRCRICEKSFYTKSARDGHELMHSTKKDFVCEYCGNAFKSKSNLKLHILKKHISPKKFKRYEEKMQCRVRCNECNKTVNLRCLKMHMASHSERTFTCDICKKKFIFKHHLNTHMVVHTHERKYKCNVCEFAFSLKHHLESHLKTKHKIFVQKKNRRIPADKT